MLHTKHNLARNRRQTVQKLYNSCVIGSLHEFEPVLKNSIKAATKTVLGSCDKVAKGVILKR